MDLLTQILIGLGLSMDAVAVSIAGGANARKQNKVYMAALIAALFFGFFQGGMFLIGGYGGEQLKNSIANLDHWIAFFLLAAIGGKMIYESMTGAEEEKRSNLRELHKIIVLAFATSIDALVVGAGLAFADGNIISTATIVALITATLSFIAVFVGERLGHVFEEKAELIGGIVLILIGIKIVLEHIGLLV